MKIASFVSALVLILASVAARAAAPDTAPTKWPIHMDCGHGNGDHVGVRLCTALRDEIAKSARYYETNSETGLQFNLHLVSVGDDSESATALVLTFQGEEKGAEETYVDVWATITGGTKVASQADDVFAAIDDQIQKLINRARKQPAS